MEQKGSVIDIEKEMKRIEELNKHYKILYRKIAFLCCSGETKGVRKQRNSLKKDLKEMRSRSVAQTNRLK